MAETLKDARKVARKLEAYAPSYSAALLAEGSERELNLWRSSRELQSRFDTLRDAYLLSVSAELEAGMRPQRAGGYFAWSNPDAVHPAELRLGQNAEVLAVATAPSGYDLRTAAEVLALIDEMQSTLPPSAPANARTIVRMGVCQ